MKHTIIEKAALKAKSEETGIPFSNLLAGYVLEELMYLIEDSPFSLFLWLKNSGALGVEQYRKKNLLTPVADESVFFLQSTKIYVKL